MGFVSPRKASGELDHIANQLIALRDSLISAQELIQDLQYRLSLESDKVRFLKEKLGEVEKTKAEIEKYELHEIVPGKFVYTPKESVAPLAPSHCICTNCAGNNFKSILQTETQGSFVWLVCHHCGSKIETKTAKGRVHLI
ncbi:hypothetical protein [Candidatus Sodalis sp. SoCistrobi]|uniref:hypothetical protein n=1 Tax=Candidatus Sodalis sp. SoCistrobi TaxID=1922216 RepID=UPI000F77024C|nr:hypothetical protein [Candidatus Sodalis sp. SoCistrobi]